MQKKRLFSEFQEEIKKDLVATAPQAMLPCEQLCNNAETIAGSVNIPTEPDNTLPHYLVDNLPDCHFDAAVNCKLGDTTILSAEQ